MRVGLGVAVAREVLDATLHTGITQSLQVTGHHRSSHVWIVREGTGTDDDVLRIGIHVSHGGKVNIESVTPQIAANGVAAVVSLGGVTGLSDGLHRLEFLNIETAVVGNTGHAATLLVDTEQRLAVQCTYFRDEISQLCLVIDIVSVEDDTADGIVGIVVLHSLSHRLHLQRGKVLRLHSRIKRLGTDKEHLPYLLAHSHLFHLCLNIVGNRFYSIVIVVRTRCDYQTTHQDGAKHPKFNTVFYHDCCFIN